MLRASGILCRFPATAVRQPTRSRVADHPVGQPYLQPVAGFESLSKSQRSVDDVLEYGRGSQVRATIRGDVPSIIQR